MSSLLPYFTTFYIFCSIIILNCHASLLQRSLYSKNWLGPSPDWTNPAMIDHSSYLIQSYHNICKRELIPLKLLKSNPVEAAKQLYYREDLVVLSHGLQDGVDGPILNYANIAAQKRW